MKKIFLVMLLVVLFSCGGKKETKEDTKDNISNQITEKQLEVNKKRLEIEAKFEEELMATEVETENFKEYTDNDVKEIKELLQKRFSQTVITAVTKDGRFKVVQAVKDGKNKKETAKEVVIDRADIINTIGEWCEKKGLEFNFIVVEFFDFESDKKINEVIYYSYILQIIYEDEEYTQEFREAFDKYKKATKY